MANWRIRVLCLLAVVCSGAAIAAEDEAALAKEVATKGWIAYSARSERGDWEIFICRPDGSGVRNVTNTPDSNEAYPQFSQDGTKLLYRRLTKEESIDGNKYGEQGEPVLAEADGTRPAALGKSGELPWACLSPDGKRIACLALKGIEIRDLATLKVERVIKRQGFFQQLTWSPDGRSFGGVSNGFGTAWAVARIDVESGKANPVSTIDCCTPDWMPGGERMIFSNRVPEQKTKNGYGWTQLWAVDPDGKNARLVYAEDGRHTYGGQVSPDGKYVLFTGNQVEDGDPGNRGAPMSLIRLSDTPMIAGESPAVRKLHKGAKSGPVLKLPVGWEPCWTASEAPAGQATTRPADQGRR